MKANENEDVGGEKLHIRKVNKIAMQFPHSYIWLLLIYVWKLSYVRKGVMGQDRDLLQFRSGGGS